MDSSLPASDPKTDPINKILAIYAMMNEAGSNGHMNASWGKKIISIMREKKVFWTDLARYRITKSSFEDLMGLEAKLMPTVY